MGPVNQAKCPEMAACPEVDSGVGGWEVGKWWASTLPPPFCFLQSHVFFYNHFEELQTVLFKVELINMRLTYVYPNTIETYFTPNHLVFGRQLLYSFRAILKKM